MELRLDDLIPEKADALKAVVLEKRSVLISGPAGCGKTYLVRRIVETLSADKRKCEIVTSLPKRRLELTATTGTAAMNMSFDGTIARTLHSFVGLGLAKEPIDVLVEKTLDNDKLAERWEKTDVLVIDEASMLTPAFFEIVDRIAREARCNEDVPFGGLQLVMVGDFFQLPPVLPATERSADKAATRFIFQTESWAELKPLVVELVTPFRQTEAAFVSALNRIRWGVPSAEDVKLLRSRVVEPDDDDDEKPTEPDEILPTVLFATNADVDRINARKLAELVRSGERKRGTFAAKFGYEPSARGKYPDDRRLAGLHDQLKKHCLAPETLELAVGAQVMLLWNVAVESGLCNGSRGVVLDFDGETTYPIVTFSEGKNLVVGPQRWRIPNDDGGAAYMEQIPLKLAYATTIHKSQGQSLDKVRISLDSTVRTPGQAYVALSRARTLSGLVLDRFIPSAIKADPAVVKFYEANGVKRPSQ